MPLYVKTKVRLFDGSAKEAGQLAAGDVLRSEFNTPITVLAVQPLGEQRAIEIKPRFSDAYVVGEGQPLPTVTEGTIRKAGGSPLVRRLPLEYKHYRAEELLRPKEQVKAKRPRQYRRAGEGAHAGEPLPMDPYILGSWLGDGSSQTLAITNQDKEVVDAWLSYFKDYKCRIVKKPNCMAHTYFFTEGTNSIGRKVLKAYDLIKNKHIPEIYMRASTEARLQVLAGIIDTDGYKTSQTRYEVVQVRKRLAMDIRELAQSLGFTVQYSIANKDGTQYHRLFIMGRLKDIPVKIERKRIYKAPTEQAERWREELEVRRLRSKLPMVRLLLSEQYPYFLADYAVILGDRPND